MPKGKLGGADDGLRQKDKFSFTFLEYVSYKGKVSAEIAKEHALAEFEKYRIVQDKLFQSDFDRFIAHEMS